MLENRKSEILWNIGLVLLIPVWLGLAPVWYEWYGKAENGHLLKLVYALLDGNELVNVPLALVILFFSFLWGCRIWKDNDIRLYRPSLIALMLVFLYFNCDVVVYAKIVYDLDYRCFMAILLATLLLIMVVKAIIKLWYFASKTWKERALRKNKESSEQLGVEKIKGFSDDNTTDIPDALKKYAGVIIERLLATDIKKQSYALGVTGEWGVGKTTFLNELRKKLGNRAEVVDFNPWMCSSPEQVTNDFFASLRHQLSPRHSMLSKSIKEYAKYVSNVSLSPNSTLSLDLIVPDNQDSLFERKRSLSRKFAQLAKPVVVIIDDVDRLERDEVFEVLRLIRNTADLNNVIYMVAYDKEYVTCVLEEKNIKDATAYLEKIFPVEIHLPKVEDYLIWNTLYTEIECQCNIGRDFTKRLFQRIGSDEKELILKILDNYRRAKRFARLYMLNLDYLNQQSKDELKLLDVFWLELLQMYDKRTYDRLADNPSSLLYRDGDRFKIRSGVLMPAAEKDEHKFAGEPFWKEETPNILERMFGSYIRTIRQSICYAENYDKFFTLGVSPFKLSISELNKLFDKNAIPEDIVGKWVESGKYFNSISYQLKQVSVNKLEYEQLRAFLHGILFFAMKVAPYRGNHLREVKKMILFERYMKGQDQKAHDIVKAWFESKVKDKESQLYIGKLLNCFYVTTVYNEQGRAEYLKLLISNDEIETLLDSLMKEYLTMHPEHTALDIMKEEGEMAYIFRNCCVMVKDAMATDNYCVYEQVTFDTVIGHFSTKEEKPTLEEYEKALGNLFKQETPVFDNPDDEYDYLEYMSEAYDNKMQEYFGSSYNHRDNNKLEEFKTKCFITKYVDEKGITEVPTENA